MQNKRIQRMIKWLLFLGWLFVIFFFSAQVGEESEAVSSRFVILIESLFSEGFLSSMILDLSFLVRKCAHFFVYFVLGIFTYFLLKDYDLTNRQILWFSFLFCLFYACTDEFHQLFVAGRSGRLFDVFVDTCGSSLSIFSLFWRERLHYKKKENL